jgi:hypothetical protein
MGGTSKKIQKNQKNQKNQFRFISSFEMSVRDRDERQTEEEEDDDER